MHQTLVSGILTTAHNGWSGISGVLLKERMARKLMTAFRWGFAAVSILALFASSNKTSVVASSFSSWECSAKDLNSLRYVSTSCQRFFCCSLTPGIGGNASSIMFFAWFQRCSWSALSSWSLHASIILSTEGWTYDVWRFASSSFEVRYTKSRTRLISEYDSWPSSNSLLPSINSSTRSLSCFISLQILPKSRGQLVS